MSLKIDLTLGDGAKSLGENWDGSILFKVKKTLENKIKTLTDELLIFSEYKNSKVLPFTSNNLFIHGERGTGKTTVLLSFKDWLKNFEIKNGRKPIIVGELIDDSGNTNSITFYFLSWLKSEIDRDKSIPLEIQEQIYKTINKFPAYLKNCEQFCEKINTDIEESLDYSDLSFRNEFFKLMDMYLRYKESLNNIEEKPSIPIFLFIDDIDLIFPKERLWKLLIEIYVFLSHPNIIIVSAGDIENLKLQLKDIYASNKNSINNKNENVEKIAKSLIEKTFSIRNIVRLYNVRFSEIENLTIKVSNRIEISFEEFMKGNYEGAKNEYFLLKKKPELINSPYIKALLDNIPLRTLVQILKAIHEKYSIEGSEKSIIDYCVSDIFYNALKDKTKLNLDYSTRIWKITENKSFVISSLDEFHIFVANLRNVLNKNPEEIFNYNPLLFLLKKQLKKDYYILHLWMFENIIYSSGIYTFVYFIAFLEIIFQIFQMNKKIFSTNDFVTLIEYMYLNNSNIFISERIIYENIYKRENLTEKNFLIFPLHPFKIIAKLSSTFIVFSSYIKEPQKRYYHSWLKPFSSIYTFGEYFNTDYKNYLKLQLKKNYTIEIYSVSEEEIEEQEESLEENIEDLFEYFTEIIEKSKEEVKDFKDIIDDIDIDIVQRIPEKIDRMFFYVQKLHNKIPYGYILNEFIYLNIIESLISSKPTSTAGNLFSKIRLIFSGIEKLQKLLKNNEISKTI